ncbi:HpcH/HpaI aldolase [Thioalkalivibrio sp. K90mix]|uniref:aldolase/citrate lyase family protein n=1 Tax=unclassified Thioalkalivibrio TaxID=2621013 RepID=UPI000195A49D|nr:MULTISPECIES: aldolase/citrate lyase family protein [unclassified Thioalkalivibrio]ADC71123.1 HpcH/HpaI aldolase [Thioalkalivibrio sp. K90mix]
MTSTLKHMFITASADVARQAEAAEIARIFVDMETRGKAERQGHLDTHKARHTLDDVRRISSVLTSAELMVRINPPAPQTPSEVRQAIDAGADRLMLPMFTRIDEVQHFLDAVGGQVPVTLLVETPQALIRLPSYLPLLGPQDQIHIGLNDLSLASGLDFLFEPLAGGMLEAPAALCREAGVAFGFGGVGAVGKGEVPAESILGEHVRLGSEWVILSRAFREVVSQEDPATGTARLRGELERLQAAEQQFRAAPPEALLENRDEIRTRTFRLAARMHNRSRACA